MATFVRIHGDDELPIMLSLGAGCGSVWILGGLYDVTPATYLPI